MVKLSGGNILYITVGVLMGAVIIYSAGFYRIEKIECESQYGYCNEKTSNSLKPYEGIRYFQARRKILKLLSEDILVKEYALQLRLPAKLAVRLIERKPVFAVKTEGDYYLISGDGKIIALTTTTSLPYIENKYIEHEKMAYSLGSTIDVRDTHALNVLKYLNVLYGIRTGYLKGDLVEFYVPNGPRLIFPIKGDVRVLIGSLRLIIQDVLKENWEYRLEKAYDKITIDLRFKNPVVR